MLKSRGLGGGAQPEQMAPSWADVCARHCVQQQPPRFMSNAHTCSAEQWHISGTQIHAHAYMPGALPVTLHLGVDTLGIEPRASRMLSGCDTTTPRAPWDLHMDTSYNCACLQL